MSPALIERAIRLADELAARTPAGRRGIPLLVDPRAHLGDDCSWDERRAFEWAYLSQAIPDQWRYCRNRAEAILAKHQTEPPEPDYNAPSDHERHVAAWEEKRRLS